MAKLNTLRKVRRKLLHTGPHPKMWDCTKKCSAWHALFRYRAISAPVPHVVLVGDIVSGFEAHGPFESGTDAARWAQSTGVREHVQRQWYIMALKEPKLA